MTLRPNSLQIALSHCNTLCGCFETREGYPRKGRAWPVPYCLCKHEAWVIQVSGWHRRHLYIFGFKTHDVIAGSRSSTFNFLIRQIFKWAGALWTQATQPEDCVKRNPVINFYYFSLLTLILVRTLRVSIKKLPFQWFLQWMSFCLHIFVTGLSLNWWQLPTSTTCQSHWIKTFIYCSQGNVIISVMVAWLL